GARSDLRHDSAEGCVLVHLRENDVRQDTATAIAGAFHHRSRGFVAGGFDPEDDHRVLHAFVVIPGRRVSDGPGIHTPMRCGLWIPGSLAPLAPRNDEARGPSTLRGG